MGAIFMPLVEDYKLFHNSLDFEKIYKESLISLQKIYPDIEEFYRKYTDICIRNKTIKLLYNEKEIIGYVLFSIKDKILKFHFYYITSKDKNRKHGRFFRQQIFEQLKDKVDILQTSINKTNFPALNAAKKSCKHLNLNFNLKEINNPFYVCNQFVCEIQKKPLDGSTNVV
jgi:hypothetical protein